jgi:hypothetical protein
LRNPKKQMAWVALAGPAANFIMALAGCCCQACCMPPGCTKRSAQGRAGRHLRQYHVRVQPGADPPARRRPRPDQHAAEPLAYQFASIEPYGFFIVLGLLYVGADQLLVRADDDGHVLVVLRLILPPIYLLLN